MKFFFLTKKMRQQLALCMLLLPGKAIVAQEISFGSSGLTGENVQNPTSIDFGPDGKLYVSQQDGTLWRFDVTRNNAVPGEGSYSITTTENISLIKNGVPNHTDDGIIDPTQIRQVTGILTAGTAQNPIVYATSSDYLIGGGGSGQEKDIDTNSGVLSKLTWDGNAWQKIDLVRGLPRCEENHSINGLELFERDGNSYLLIQQGGHSNKGAPSNNFAGTSEYFLSGNLLIMDLTQLESMPVYTDPRTNTDYVYDLPTLNDPNREDIDNTDARFPYPATHPLYNATIDVGDPFGGDDGLNQAFAEVEGPVQVFSPGYRNAYDVVVTKKGHIYTFGNGPNTGWGGQPVIYTSDDVPKGDQSTTTYNPEDGDYIKNDFNESGSQGHGDALHFVGSIHDANGTYYGGHPSPIAAFPSRSDLITYKNSSGEWLETSRYQLENLLDGVSGYFQSSFDIDDFPDDPRQGEYLADQSTSAKVNILDVINASTNGMCEYTASNFDGVLKGSLLSASFNGNIWRHVPSDDGLSLVAKELLFNGFGSNPLDVIALPDGHPFAGTVWAVTYGANNITVFEPSDTTCIESTDPDFDPLGDDDNDGYSNQDELDNNTNLCSAGSTPKDYDDDFISDLNDQDDDNDGILDVEDAYALDPNNGTTTNLPIRYPFWNNDPGTGFFGLGFTGLMLDPSGNTDYLTQFDETNLDFGGASGKASINLVPDGDAYQNVNTQEYAFQFGINVDQNSDPFTIHSRVESPFFGINGVATAPIRYQSAGIFIGNGDQDNYLKFVIGFGTTHLDTIDGIEILLENEGITTSERYDIENLLDGNAVDFLIDVNPESNEAQPLISLDGGVSKIAIGEPITLPTSFLDPTDTKGLAVGIIATSFSNDSISTPFTAIWDFINITEEQSNILTTVQDELVFEEVVASSAPIDQNITIQNQSNPLDPPIEITEISITGPDSALFSTTAMVPLNIASGTDVSIPIRFSPDATSGVKNASITITYTGAEDPLVLPVTATIIEGFAPNIRINAGSTAFMATDQGPDWLANNQKNSVSNDSYSVNTGNIGTFNLPFAQRHSSIPDYIDEATYTAIFAKERWDAGPAPEMEFIIPVANGDHIVNLFLGNGWGGTTEIGERIYDIEIEGIIVKDDLDLITEFGGHQVGGMLSFPVTVFDETISIRFLHEVQNPLINAIEVLSAKSPEIVDLQLTAIEDLTSNPSESIDFAVLATGGDPAKNYIYEITGQPAGILIEPTNGQISGIIEETAADGGPANDGTYLVTVSVRQEGIEAISTQFLWTIVEENSVRYRINVGGLLIADETMDWEQDLPKIIYGSGSPGVASPYVNANDADRGSTRLFSDSNNTTGYPSLIFATTRFSVFDAPRNQQWDFPVTNGTYTVNLLFAENWTGAQIPGIKVFDIYLEDTMVAQNFDVVEAFGWATAGTLSFNVHVTDNNLDLDFGKVVENPMVSGIEIIELNEVSSFEATNNNLLASFSKSKHQEEVSQHLERNLIVHPIPASEIINFELKNGTNDLINDIEIRSITSNVLIVESIANNQSSVQIAVGNLAKGIYIATITSSKGGVTTTKISIY